MVDDAAEPSVVADAIRSDAELGLLVSDLVPHPVGQIRLWRGHLAGSTTRCVLKVDLGELEALWMPAVSDLADDVVVRVLGRGTLPAVGRPWLLLEDLPFRARSDRVDDVVGVMRATARFQEVAAGLSLPTYPIDAHFFTRYTEEAIAGDCPGPARRVLDDIEAHDRWLSSLGGHVAVHGDVHFWNALAASPRGPWRLIDPIPRRAHWAWDAAYAQMTSGVPATPDLIEVLTAERRRLGLAVAGSEQADRLRRVLLGLSSLLWWAIAPARRSEPWWRNQVEHHVSELTDLRTPTSDRDAH